MITLFATEEIPLSDIKNALKKEGAEVSPIVLTSQLRDKSTFSNIHQAFFVCSERSISIVGERTKQVRDLIGESAVLTVCATAISSEHRKSLIACGATRIVTPQTFATSHIVERLLSQVIFDGDIKPSKYGSLVGATKVMREIYRHIGILAPLDEPILIVYLFDSELFDQYYPSFLKFLCNIVSREIIHFLYRRNLERVKNVARAALDPILALRHRRDCSHEKGPRHSL